MKVLILSCPTGQGHNAVAHALEMEMKSRGVQCQTMDALKFVSQTFSSMVGKGHSCVYRYFPKLSDFSYSYAEKHEGVFSKSSPVYRFLTSGAEKLYALWRREPFDAVICTHVFAALLWTKIKRRHHPPVYSCFVATDYTCSPGVDQTDMDVWFIPDEKLIGEFAAAGLPREKLIAAGIPVRAQFYQREEKQTAKQLLGLCPEKQHLLMMCGSMGCGPMDDLAALLAPLLMPDAEMTMVCGTNEARRRQLQRRLRKYPAVHICGYTDNVSLLMDASDLFLTKPGGVSVTEAAVKGLPMALIHAVAGCEEHNRNFFVASGGAVSAASAEELKEQCLSLLRSPARRAEMTCALSGQTLLCGAKTIAEHLLFAAHSNNMTGVEQIG